MSSLVLIALLSTAAAPGTARPEATDSLTVVTLNLWHDQHEWPRRLAVILPKLRELHPDVICLQEVLQHEHLRNQAETFGDSLGYQVFFTSTDGVHDVKRYGNAILTRHPVLRTDEKKLEPLNDYRTAAHVRMDVKGRVVDVYDTHLHHTPEGGKIRATQIGDLLAFIDSTRGDGAVVLAGDFNAQLDTPELQRLTQDYDDVFRVVHPAATLAEAVTYNPIFGIAPGAIDHVFVPRDARSRLEPRGCEILFKTVGPDSVWASDHFGVAAWLKLSGGGR
jgi:endonuclease/exonuclease/phosphatase family metal-dependent hydrolase